jgi:predicted ATPase/class 3 adenylate cyclase
MASTSVATGVLSFCLTDIEGSTPLWERSPGEMRAAVAAHDALVAAAVAGAGGFLVQSQGEGDSTLSVFQTPAQAMCAAIAIHAALAEGPRVNGEPLRVRVGIHTGSAESRRGTFFGPTVNRAARVRALAAGGQTLLSAATAVLLGADLPAGHELRDAGVHELRGLTTPEHVFFCVQEDEPTPLIAEPDPVLDLPIPTSSFVGREDDLRTVGDLLRSNRLVSITGVGGAGKTRLASAATLEFASATGRRVVAVDLTSAASPDLVPTTVAAALDLLLGASLDKAQAVERIASAIARLDGLVLLDNCEHVLAEIRELVLAVLQRSGPAVVLATTQAPFEIPGEVVFTLGGMGIEGDAVRLFQERAAAVGGSVAETDVAAIEGLCRQLDGLPLAIELAAAHAHILAPAEIAARLASMPDHVLAARSSVGPPRQQSVRAAIEWSVGLLDDRSRQLLARLPVFEGGFAIESAEAVCSGAGIADNDVFDLLSRLVQRSLVVRRRVGMTSRYWLLDSTRRFAGELLGAAATAASLTMRREGGVWAFTDQTGTVRLRDALGLRYLAALLRRPRAEVHVVDLVAGEKGERQVPVQSGLEVLDEAARRSYAERVRQLEEDLDEANAANDIERSAIVAAELDAVLEQLARASGLGGRGRRTSSTVERARASVTKAIRGSIAAVAAHAPEIGAHLQRSIRTGVFCSYAPDEGDERLTVEL